MPVESGGGGVGWSAEQKRNAATIIQIGRQMGVGRRGILVGLVTAMQESSLKNVNYGDRDSLGLFQQRPSMGWGTAAQVQDPVYATRKFFTELKKVDNWQKMPLTVAAQSVQRSGFPDAYAKWESDARLLLKNAKGKITPVDAQNRSIRDPLTELAPKRNQLRPNSPTDMPKTTADGGMPDIGVPDLDLSDDESPGSIVPEIDTSLGSKGGPGAPGLAAPSAGRLPAGMLQFSSPDDYAKALDQRGTKASYGKGMNNVRRGIVERAQEVIGVPYAWGGTDLSSGVDCSGFIQSVYKEMGVDIPRVSYQQATAGKKVNLDNLRPGDLVAWDNSSRNNGADHIAIYLGNGRIIEAAKPGTSVRIRKLRDNEDAWGVDMSKYLK